MVAEKQKRAAQGEVQYLTESQLQIIVEQDTGSDIRDYEDLQTGIGTPPFTLLKCRKLHSELIILLKMYI